MKSGVINLTSYYNASLNPEIFTSFKKINSIDNLRDSEEKSISSIYKEFDKILAPNDPRFSGYLLGKVYIGVVSEEFDILRFSPKKIINIELKSQNVPEDRIKKQLRRHSYILKSINSDLEVSLYTYVQEDGKLYKYLDNDSLIGITFDQLLKEIPFEFIEHNLLETLYDSSFIISPYSEPERFSKSQYFLNNEQEKAKEKILKTKKKVVGLRGAAGTGKSLVLFDTAKNLASIDKKVLFIFCSRLSEWKQINSAMPFEFIDIREANNKNDDYFKQFNIIIIDESQRLKENQFKRYIVLLKNSQNIEKLILSVDKKQTLRKEEKELNVEGVLREKKETIEFIDCLTEHVRTDLELSTFIEKLFDKHKDNLTVMEFPKVNAVFFENKKEALPFIKNCYTNEGFISIEMPQYGTMLPKLFNFSLDGFNVIGREFNKVLLPLSKRILHSQDGELVVPVAEQYKYLAEHGLFQAITRVKSELLLVVIGNIELYKTIAEILTWKKFRDNQRTAKRIKSLREINNIDIQTISNELRLSQHDYLEIESTGIVNSSKTLGKLAKFYNVRKQYFEGEPLEFDYSKIDLIYRKKINTVEGKELRNSFEEDIINFIQSWGEKSTE